MPESEGELWADGSVSFNRRLVPGIVITPLLGAGMFPPELQHPTAARVGARGPKVSQAPNFRRREPSLEYRPMCRTAPEVLISYPTIG